jgi:hypothetical protein
MELPNRVFNQMFVVVMLALISATFLVYSAKIDSTNFENIVVWVVGLFVVGNVGDGAAKGWMTSFFAKKEEVTNAKPHS